MVAIRELRSVALFAGLSDHELAKISALLAKKTYKKGEKIYGEGEPGGQLCIIQQGEVAITHQIYEGEKKTFNTLSSGMYFGIVSLIDGKSHSATATASENTELWVLNKADFERLVQDDPACGTKILKEVLNPLCLYMRQMNDKFVDMIKYVSLDR